MALIGAVYKWRLDCDTYAYITDASGNTPFVVTNECVDNEDMIKEIVSSWDENMYCQHFNDMVNYVHSIPKFRNLRFLDCSVYLKEYYGCEEMLKPSFPTGIQLNLSATSVDYNEEADAVVTDVKCIIRDGEKITSYDINFEIPKGIPGLTLKGVIHGLSDLDIIENNQHNNINDGYLLDPLVNDTGYPVSEQKGALYVYRGSDYIFPETSIKYGKFEYISNLRGPAGETPFRYDETLNSYSFGDDDSATGINSFSQGSGTTASGNNSHVEGLRSQAIGRQSHAEGTDTIARANQSHTEGYGTQAWANGGHAEGDSTIAYGCYSHSEGANTVTGSQSGIAPTVNNIAMPSNNGEDNGGYAHAEGASTIAYGKGSHSEGIKTMAVGVGSHAEGIGNVAINEGQHVGGLYATIDETGDYLFQIGVGVDENNREDAFVIKKDGTVIIYTTE